MFATREETLCKKEKIAAFSAKEELEKFAEEGGGGGAKKIYWGREGVIATMITGGAPPTMQAARRATAEKSAREGMLGKVFCLAVGGTR